jgi:hypothetical protein
VALGLLLALSTLLFLASKAEAGRYAVAQCGWYVGADASWADTTSGTKFRSDAFCVPPAGSDPFDGAHLKSLSRDGQSTVSGTRFARWRWTAPPTTGITQVRGTWWHALHDGIEQRLGGVGGGGDFNPFLTAGGTDVTPREFSKGFPSPVAGFEDRLLCARGEDRWCSLDAASWSALRALTLTVEDSMPPGAWMTGGDLLDGGWRRGSQFVAIAGFDHGAGVRFGETRLDGARVGFTEYPCEKVSIGGEWRGTRMQPCLTSVSATQTIATSIFSDGAHTVDHCTTDFADNTACAPSRTVLIDNNPPAHPRSIVLAGGEGWRRTDDFDLAWENPDQGPASPIAGAGWRLSGGLGFDTGVRFAPGRDRRSLLDIGVPGAGSYSLQLWLRDEAGNEAPTSALTVPLRFDDVQPKVSFSTENPEDQVKATVVDEHSGPASGQIVFRRVDAERWIELPTKRIPGDHGAADLVAPLPDLGVGTFVFRVDTADFAGNTASSTLRADGTQMAVRRVPPPPVARAKPVPRVKSRLFARLRGGHGRGDALTVPFGAPALISGRLTRADGAGLGGRELRVVSRPSRGALLPTAVEVLRTGVEGGFELTLPPGPSRRIAVAFAGDGGQEEARRAGLELRVRSGLTLRAMPRQLDTGQVVTFSGKVKSSGTPIPRRGKLVAIQYLEAATHRWRPVLVTRSDHHGRFRAHYRFRYVSGRAAIRLRATALAEERWPYAPGSSAPVTVRVQG